MECLGELMVEEWCVGDEKKEEDFEIDDVGGVYVFERLLVIWFFG